MTADLGPSHSPDRADALVHAVTHLILDRTPSHSGNQKPLVLSRSKGLS